jgi:hypothetical protein
MIDSKSFVFDPPRRRFQAGFRLDDVNVVVTVAPPAQTEQFPEQAFARAFDWIFRQWEKILEYCAKELLETKNSGWLKDGEAPWDASRFKRKLRLREISVHEDGGVTLTFLDGGMFWGHWVVVEANAHLTLESATLAG